MKRFLMFSVSVLCLAVAVLIGFYVGSQRVEAQAGATVIGYNTDNNSSIHHVMLANGDVYSRNYSISTRIFGPAPAAYAGNFFDGSGVVGTDESTWSEIKKR